MMKSAELEAMGKRARWIAGVAAKDGWDPHDETLVLANEALALLVEVAAMRPVIVKAEQFAASSRAMQGVGPAEFEAAYAQQWEDGHELTQAVDEYLQALAQHPIDTSSDPPLE